MDAINDWENQALTHRNRLAPHAYFMGYETADLAATYSRELSRGFVQLSGSWQFRLFEGPAAVSNKELSTYEPELVICSHLNNRKEISSIYTD